MKIQTVVARHIDERPALEVAAEKLRARGFQVEVVVTEKVTKTAKSLALLRTDAPIRAVRKARENTMGTAAFHEMLAKIGGKG